MDGICPYCEQAVAPVYFETHLKRYHSDQNPPVCMNHIEKADTYQPDSYSDRPSFEIRDRYRAKPKSEFVRCKVCGWVMDIRKLNAHSNYRHPKGSMKAAPVKGLTKSSHSMR